MSTFGDLERAFADLYPYRWAFAAGLIVFMALATGYAYRQGWHNFLWQHRVKAGIVATPVLVVTLWLGWSLGSPLFTNTTVDEAFPFAVTATVPPYMGIEDVETIMAGMAKIASPVDEEMPDMDAQAPPVQASPTPTPETTAGEPTPAPAPTEVLAAAGPVILKHGMFMDTDSFHQGSGTATIYEGADGSRILRLENFKVTNGPDLHVVLSPYAGPEEIGGSLKSPGWVDLGKLKGNIGNQNYEIPDGVDIGSHNSVTIWCKPFNVIFSVAVLQGAS
jgi:hypothetical protein